MRRYCLALKASLATGILLALPAYSQQPPDVVSSDNFGNTAAGDSALQNILTPLNTCTDEPNSCNGVWNTAVGANALGSATNAQGNTATGLTLLLQIQSAAVTRLTACSVLITTLLAQTTPPREYRLCLEM